MNYTGSVSSNRSKKVDRKSVLELDNILVWEVSSSNSREYMISLQGYSEDNSLNRVMVCDGSKESSTISRYQRNGYRISCCSVACRMTIKEQESYNKSLNSGLYDQCIGDLFSLEIYLNRKYGYNIKGKVNQKRRFK